MQLCRQIAVDQQMPVYYDDPIMEGGEALTFMSLIYIRCSEQ